MHPGYGLITRMHFSIKICMGRKINCRFIDLVAIASLLTICGTGKLQLFYGEILPELKNKSMPKTVNAICKQIIKVKKIIRFQGCISAAENFQYVCSHRTHCDAKG